MTARIGATAAAAVLVDCALDERFVLRGSSLARNGLPFTPVIRARAR